MTSYTQIQIQMNTCNICNACNTCDTSNTHQYWLYTSILTIPKNTCNANNTSTYTSIHTNANTRQYVQYTRIHAIHTHTYQSSIHANPGKYIQIHAIQINTQYKYNTAYKHNTTRIRTQYIQCMYQVCIWPQIQIQKCNTYQSEPGKPLMFQRGLLRSGHQSLKSCWTSLRSSTIT